MNKQAAAPAVTQQIEPGMAVTGSYCGVPFEGAVREIDDSWPAMMHGQPAGRRCYIDLTTPIVLDRGKSFERTETSISAFAVELKVAPNQ